MRNPFEVYTSVNGDRKPRGLEWEESALDKYSYVEGFFDEDRPTPSVRWLWFALTAVFLVIAYRLFSLQVVKGNEYRMLSEGNRIRRQTLLAPRGLIRDRRGEALAQNTASYNLAAVPFDLPKEGLGEQVDKLVALLGLNRQEVDEVLSKVNRKSFEPVIIKQDIAPEQSILFETRANEFVGFSVLKIPIREYPEPQVFSHVLGYTGMVSAQDLEKVDKDLYDSNDFIGKLGIELQYERYLHGENGYNQVEVDATGKVLKVLGENQPEPGNILVLNIDRELQQKLYEGFAGGSRGAAVAMNPKTGEVLALLSVPGFDNNKFAHGIKNNEYQSLLQDKSLPLFNRAIAGTYPPGSTVKPMVAAAALEEGIVNENTVITDRGVLVIPNQYNPAISYNFYGWKRSGLGPMNVRSAIAESSDIYFYVVTGGHPSSPIKGMGAEKLAEYYRKFNVGKVTGIDLQGEKPGVVADPAWKAEYFKDDAIMSKWYLGDTYHIGIGQGDMLTTPLQVTLWTAAVANNGTAYKPRILQKVIGSDGKTLVEPKPEALVSDAVSKKTLTIVQEGMRQTVLAGSARQLSTLPISSAGKTGTSQFDGADPSRTHAWFTAYAPFEDPQIAITVLVEAGGEGHAAAVPIVKDVLKWWAENRYNKQ